MWYILDAKKESIVYSGFKKDITREEFLQSLDSGTAPELINSYNPVPGDSFIISPGTIHTFGNGVVLVEIQQTSDITYRVSDWGRVDSSGIARELHTELALETINFDKNINTRSHLTPVLNQPVEVSKCEYFTVNLHKLSGKSTKDYALTDSFIIFFCLSGSIVVESDGTAVTLGRGETILIPAISNIVTFDASIESEYLEIYIELNQTNN
jgi:mannose-6-phosphate isomerase